MKKVRSIEDLLNVTKVSQHILTLFSGGLDSTYILEVIKHSNVKVTALCVDLGDEIDTQNLQQIARHYGVELKIVDAKQALIEQSIVPAIQAQALYLGDYPVSSSLSRPIIVEQAVSIANQLGCDAIIHTANQSQNSLRRLNNAIEASNFNGYYGSPYEYSALSRADKVKALNHAGFNGLNHRVVSGDSNLWCREFESGILDNPEQFTLPESLFDWSNWNTKRQLHFQNNSLTIGFVKGHPVTLNDQPIHLLDLIDYLNRHVGAYEIGRYVGFDHLDQDEKVLEIREAPAAKTLMLAYKHLQTAILPTDVLTAKTQQDQSWTMEAVEGRWHSPLQQANYAFIAHTSNQISGKVTFQLSRGNLLASAIIAEQPRYLTDRDNWEIAIADKRSRRHLTVEHKSLLQIA